MRASLGLRWFDEFGADLRYAARMLRKSPGFTLTAALSLALAIGANTAIFSVAKEILYDRLGVAEPRQLRLLGWTSKGKPPVGSWWSAFNANSVGMTSECISYPRLSRVGRTERQVIDLFAFKDFTQNGTVRGNPQRLGPGACDGKLLRRARRAAASGAHNSASDDGAPGTGAVAVISYGLWQREFGGSPTVLGQTIQVERADTDDCRREPAQLYRFGGLQINRPDLFAPLSMQPLVAPMGGKEPSLLSCDGQLWLEVMGRAKPVFLPRHCVHRSTWRWPLRYAAC